MALLGYFDGSLVVGKCMALTCVAADGSVWTDLEQKWTQVLEERGNASYLHMTDAISLNGIYEGWTPEERDHLIEGCLSVLNSYMDNPLVRSFTASVDLAAYDRLKNSKNHPSPERLCARIVFPHVLDWYGTFPDRIIGISHFYFDGNEPFMRHIRADWENKGIRRQYPAWSLVKTIEAIPMQKTPPLQMADLICWGFSRQAAGSHWETDRFYTTAVRAANAVRGTYRVVGEEALAKSYFREEGHAARDRQRRRLGKRA